ETAIQLYQTEAQDLADTLYEIDMEGGGTSNAYETPFFDEDEWNFLTTNGPGNFAGTNVDYHPDDDGTGDDTTANDGFIPEPVLGNLTNEVRALTSGSFTDEEFNAFKDPLYAFTSGSTTELDDNFTTVTADITGTGSTLTLDFRGLFNGNQEFLIFDNIIISGDLIGGMLVPGDANGDMIVDTADLAILAGNFGMMNIVGGIGVGDFNEDGNVDTGDLAILAGNFGFGTGPVATAVIPEPASLALIGAGLGLAGLRRRRSA
ncbi:MAG: PEP-CTERM sorting domain-containing protein, partial [Planctomycetota bacterium]